MKRPRLGLIFGAASAFIVLLRRGALNGSVRVEEGAWERTAFDDLREAAREP